MQTLAERLITEREAQGLTQPELARRAKISQSFVAALETGLQRSSGWLPEIAYALGLHAMWLKTGIGPKSLQATIGEPSSPVYSTNVTPLPISRPLMRELTQVAERMSERGLQVLIYEAEKIDKLYPKAEKNSGSS